jgi:XTP/dITP diphosphohydrolase
MGVFATIIWSIKTMKIIFATNNKNKVTEIQAAIGNIFNVVSLAEAGIDIDIPEPHDTLEANASEKSGTIFKMTGENCFSEDTGLEVAVLNGEPGVKSARYAGDGKDPGQNIDKLLSKLEGATDRRARFRTVISLIRDGKEYLFEGICEGEIIPERRGSNGFGYDPVFIPKGSTWTLAQMTLQEKNRFSHRRKAADKLVGFLQQKGN